MFFCHETKEPKILDFKSTLFKSLRNTSRPDNNDSVFIEIIVFGTSVLLAGATAI
jgi:hypothetical protein